MSIKIQALSNPVATIALIFSLIGPLGTVSATRMPAAAAAIVKPASIVSTRGTTVGSVTRLRTQDQSGTVDTPANYVLFQTPAVAYKGYRTYSLPAGVWTGTVTSLAIKVNYKGPAKASQMWTWNLYDWVYAAWVKVGDNTGVTANVWKVLKFTMAADASRLINNSTRQIRLQVISNNAAYDAKLDYEAITLTYYSCADTLGCVVVPPGSPMHIAYILNTPELQSKNGAEVATDDAGGSILGHSIQFEA